MPRGKKRKSVRRKSSDSSDEKSSSEQHDEEPSQTYPSDDISADSSKRLTTISEQHEVSSSKTLTTTKSVNSALMDSSLEPKSQDEPEMQGSQFEESLPLDEVLGSDSPIKSFETNIQDKPEVQESQSEAIPQLVSEASLRKNQGSSSETASETRSLRLTPSAANNQIKAQDKSVIPETPSEPSLSPAQATRGGATRGRGRRGRGRGRRVRIFSDLDDEESLFTAVTNNPTAHKDIVDQWIEKYKSNKEEAMLMMIQFFVDSIGSIFSVTPEMNREMEYKDIVSRMMEEDEDDSADYPLVKAGEWKKFRDVYASFINTLVRCCRNSLIYDEYFNDPVVTLLVSLSDSEVRAYRHTATFAAMKLMIALADLAAKVSNDFKNIRRQWEAEHRKSRDNRASRRLEVLAAKQNEYRENLEEIKGILMPIFQFVFQPRYIDFVVDIRVFCITDLGLCMLKFPEYFLNDNFLKYIGWSLGDDAGEVRLKCLEVIQPLLASEEFAPKLDLFARKFKDRIVAMSLDEEFDVGARAVKVFTSMLMHHREIVTEDDCEKIYELVFAANRDLAHAAGEFVNERIFKLDEDSIIDVRTRRGKQRFPYTSMIRDLVIFFHDSGHSRLAAFLVDSLIDTNKMMKDWECMTDLLLEEPGPEEETLDDNNEACLIELMVCCIKQAATGETPIGRESARKILSATKQIEIHEDKQKMTEHFIDKLPLLLGKYRADPKKVMHLLAVPQYFDVRMYTTLRQEPKLENLLTIMQGIIKRMHDHDVLETAGKTFEIMCSEELGIFRQCDVARRLILDDIVGRYREVNDRYETSLNESEGANEEIYNVIHSLKKVSIYYSLHNMSSYDLWNSVWKILEDVRFSVRKLPDEGVTHCIKICYFSIIWRKIGLMKSEDSNVRTATETRQLVHDFHAFMDLLMFFIGGDGNASAVLSSQFIREEAYNSICDFLLFFNKSLLNSPNRVIHQLVFTPDQAMRTMLSRFVQENVFSEMPDDSHDDDWKIEQLHKRRNFLASYCKLIIGNSIPPMSAANIMKHYVEHFEHYSDILKEIVGKIRDSNRLVCAKIIMQSLKIAYNEMVEANGKEFRFSEAFTAVKVLAKRFSLLFGMDFAKNSEAFLALHGDGFHFAITPPDGVKHDLMTPTKNLPFLEVLVEFSNKLSREDRAQVLEFVDKKFPKLPPKNEEWNSLHIYRSSLIKGIVSTGRAQRNAQSRNDNTAGEEVDEGSEAPTPKPQTKSKKKKVLKKPKLPVTKVKLPRGRKAPSLEDSDEPEPTVSLPVIEDPSQEIGDSTEDRLQSLQIQTPSNSPRLFED